MSYNAIPLSDGIYCPYIYVNGITASVVWKKRARIFSFLLPLAAAVEAVQSLERPFDP
jgi:hypothetical protein